MVSNCSRLIAAWSDYATCCLDISLWTSIGTGIVEVDIGFLRGGPLLVDFDEDGGDEAERGKPRWGRHVFSVVRRFSLLLDRALDGVGGAHAPPVLPGSLKTARPSGTLFSSQSASWAQGAVLGHEALKLLLRVPRQGRPRRRAARRRWPCGWPGWGRGGWRSGRGGTGSAASGRRAGRLCGRP